MDTGLLAIFIPLLALMIPIVVILTRHQQRMAEIVHRTAGDHSELTALRHEIAELKSLVHQQAITLDTLAGMQRTLSAPPSAPAVAERLSAPG